MIHDFRIRSNGSFIVIDSCSMILGLNDTQVTFGSVEMEALS